MSVEAEANRQRRALKKMRLPIPMALRTGRLAHLARRPPLLAHLVFFALIVLVPALMFSALLIVQFSSQQQQITASQVNDTAEILSNAFDREIVGMKATARVLATSGAISSANFRDFHERTVRALAGTQLVADLIDTDRRIRVSSFGAFPPPPRTVGTGSAVERAIATGIPQVSGVYFSVKMQARVFSVILPVGTGARPPFVLRLTRPIASLDTVIDDRNLPRAWSTVVVDAEDQLVFAATSSGGQMRRQQGISADRPSIAETMPGGQAADMLEASIFSQQTGWKTTVAVPNSVIELPILRSWFLLVVVGFLLLAFSVALGIVFGRRIARPILDLSNQAHAIGRGEPATAIRTDIAEIGEVSKVLSKASRERREAEEQTRFLMREMTHRAKNQYALIAAIARRAARESANTGEFLETLSDALASLARSADLLSGRGWESVDLEALVDNQLSAFGVGAGRIDRSGPPAHVNASAAQTIGLALHELATNAAKYGSLSVDEGRVEIRWSIGERFAMSWQEVGGPKVVRPSRSGFGTLVTQKMTARGLSGEVDMRFDETGVVWKLDAPAEMVLLEAKRAAA